MSLHLSCVTGRYATEFAMLIGKGNTWYCEECLSCNKCAAFKDEVSVQCYRYARAVSLLNSANTIWYLVLNS